MPPIDIHASPLHLIHRVAQAASVVFKAETSEHDITERRFAVLAMVLSEADLSQTDIVIRTGIDRSTVSNVIKELVARKYVTRKRSKIDSRAYVVNITDAGRQLMQSVAPAAARVDRYLATIFSPRTLRELQKIAA
jgi:DNA-binding MarR family transcriptional regulator